MNEILSKTLTKTDTIKRQMDSLRPMLNDTIIQAMDIEYTYDSNRIEGNTLTLRETDLVINKGLTVGGKSMQEHLEAINHYEAIYYIRDLVKKGTPIAERIIKEIHAIILRGIDRENAGKYRNVPVAISGSKHVPPQPLLLPVLMEETESWIKNNTNAVHPIIFAALLHERIATIHPFIDGNGRTARLLMNLVLLQNGYTLANIPGDTESRLDYYNSLEKCNIEKDKNDFIILIAGYVLESMEKIYNTVIGKK